jgi:hypothetical protein
MPSLEASLRNLKKARAAWRHAPRPWRSARESRVIKRLVWQWFMSSEPEKWSGRAVARWLDVSHTYVQKLVKGFEADPSEMQRDTRHHVPATFEHLRHAQEETRKQKERGWLRPMPRSRVAEFKIGDEVVRAVIPTKAEEERRQATKTTTNLLVPEYLAPHNLPLWAKGMPYYSPENPCDPLIAVKHEMEEQRGARSFRLRPRRRWRPGRSSLRP